MDLTVHKKAKTYKTLPNELLPSNNETNSTTPSISLYLQEISKYSVLTPIEEQELAKKIVNGDKKAKDTFVNSNLRLVVSIEKKYQTEKYELLDLIQEGNLGLLKAVEMFDYTKGIKFSTYATLWIKQYIIRAIANKGNCIRVPICTQELISKYQSIQNNYYQANGTYATDDEIFKIMKNTIGDVSVKEIKSYIFTTISLSAPVSSEDDTCIEDLLQDTKPTPEEIVIRNSISVFNKKLLDYLMSNANLDEIEKKVIDLRYDFEHNQIRSLEYIGIQLGKNKERVRTIEMKAFSKLRRTAKKKFGTEFLYEA